MLPFAVAMFCSCNSELKNEIDLIERRISVLEQSVSTIQTNIRSLETLVEALNSRDFVTDVIDNYNDDGDCVSYTIYFAKSDPVTIYNGNDADSPSIGIRQLSDGHYYWTVKYPSSNVYELVKDNNDNPVMASAISPDVKIDEKGDWYVSYDNGKTWEYLGKATGDTPESFIQTVADSVDFYEFIDAEGNAVRLPSWTAFEKVKQECETANRNYLELDSLRKIIDAKLYINDIIPITDGTETVGYKLCFSDDSTQLEFYHGIPTNRPIISARKDTSATASADSLFWCVKFAGAEDFEWITVDGERVKANARLSTPPVLCLKQDTTNLYCWAVTYNGVDTLFLKNGVNNVRASAAVNARVVDSIYVNKSSVFIKVGDETFNVPRFNDFAVTFSPISNQTLSMSAGDTETFKCKIEKGDYNYTVLPVAYDGFYVTAATTDYVTWTISVTSPATFTESRLDLLISDGMGTLKTYQITIKKN